MTTEFSEATIAEFGGVATWTAAIVRELGEEYHVPGACRGSANPALLAWLAESLEVSAASRFLDVGAGMGGPAGWLRTHYAIDPFTLEPVVPAATATRSLFDLRAVAGDAEEIPLASHSIDAAWILAVLDTAGRPDVVLRELRRVLVPGGHLGVLEYVTATTGPLDAPDANSFSTREQLLHQLDQAGFLPLAECDVSALPAPPLPWQLRIGRVDDLLAERHDHEPAWRLARQQEQAFARLLHAGTVAPIAIHAIAL